jgi:hypothetical protein
MAEQANSFKDSISQQQAASTHAYVSLHIKLQQQYGGSEQHKTGLKGDKQLSPSVRNNEAQR